MQIVSDKVGCFYLDQVTDRVRIVIGNTHRHVILIKNTAAKSTGVAVQLFDSSTPGSAPIHTLNPDEFIFVAVEHLWAQPAVPNQPLRLECIFVN